MKRSAKVSEKADSVTASYDHSRQNGECNTYMVEIQTFASQVNLEQLATDVLVSFLKAAYK